MIKQLQSRKLRACMCIILSAVNCSRFQCVVPGLPLGYGNSSGEIVVNLSITVHSKHDYKLLSVIGPKRPTMQMFLKGFERNLASVSHFWVSRFSDSVRRDFKLSFQDESGSRVAGSSSPIFQSIAETGNQSFKTEEAAYYYFFKLLSNKNYSLGQELDAFISEFQSRFFLNPSSPTNQQPDQDRASILSSLSRGPESSIDVSLYQTPVSHARESALEVMKKIDEIVTKFDSNYLSLKNPSSTLVDDLLPRLRPSVDRYMFENVGRSLWIHYRKFFLEDDKSFTLKSIAIRGAHGDSLKEACGVRTDFRFDFSRSIAMMNDLQRMFDQSASLIPNAILQRLLSILVSVKTEVLTGTRGQRELESMDDIAPVFLFVLLSASEVQSPNALYHFLTDTMRSDQRLETEGRTVALLEGATRLVINDWNSPQLLDL